MKRQIPLKEGIFHIPSSPEDKGYLIGYKCKNCGAIFHPEPGVCYKCGQRGLEQVPLPTRGKIYAFSIVRQALPNTIMDKAPFVLALVTLPGLPFIPYIETVLTDCDPEAVHIDMDAELVIEKAKEDEEGNDIMVYSFRPFRD